LKTLGGHTPAIAQDEFAELLNDKRLQRKLSKQSLAYVIFGKEQKMNVQSFLI